MSKFSNVLKMIILLKSRGKMKGRELAEKLEVDERMIRKYRNDIEMAGVNIMSYAGNNGGYSIEGYDYLVDSNFSEDENVALGLAEQQLKQDNFMYYKEFKQIVDKINAVEKKDYQAISNPQYLVKGIRTFNDNVERKKCLDINAAIILKQKIKMKYFSLSSGESERIVQPYAIISYKGATYFVAYCEKRCKVIEFKSIRVKEYSILKEKYEVPKDFSLKEYMRNSIGLYGGPMLDVKLIIEKPMSYIVSEKIWSDNQKIVWNKDESINFEAEMRGKTEIISWILSMGNTVKIIGPESLKNEISEKLKRMLEKI